MGTFLLLFLPHVWWWCRLLPGRPSLRRFVLQCILNSASAIQSSALEVLAVRHRPYRAVPLWYWQSDIGHTQQCPYGTGSQTSAIQSSALTVLAVRHRPYTAVPLRYWQSDIGHTQQCPCGTDSQTSAIHSSALTVLAVRHRPYRAVPLRYWQSDNWTSAAVLPHLRATQKGNLARPHSRSPQALR